MTPLFEVRGLTKRYLGLTAVDDLSYAVEPGAMIGIIGPNGSGKSTGVDCISGFQAPDAGRWFLDGQELSGMPAHRIARAGLIRTFQNVQAYEGLSLIENLSVARQEGDGVGWLTALRRGAALRRSELVHANAAWNCWTWWDWRPTPMRRRRSCRTASASCWRSPPA